MNRRSIILLVASHLAVIVSGVVLARQLGTSSAKPADHRSSARHSTSVNRGRTETPADRPLGQWRTREYAAAWNAVRLGTLTTKERIKLQRELLAKWAEVDLQAAIKAALGESWIPEAGYPGSYVDPAGPLLGALSGYFVGNPDASWELIHAGEFGMANGVLRQLWMRAVGEKDSRRLTGMISGLSWRDRDQAIRSCGVALMNQRANITYPEFLRILTAFPEEMVSAEQIFRYGTSGIVSPASREKEKDAILKAPAGDERMLRVNAMIYGRQLFKQSADEISREIMDLPRTASEEVLCSALRFSKIDPVRTTGIIDLLIGLEAWNKMAQPEVVAPLQRFSTSEDMAKVAAWATGLPVREETEDLFDRSIEPYLKNNPDTAPDWISQIPPGVWRDRAYAQFSLTALSGQNDAEKSQWAVEQISDPRVKDEAETRRSQLAKGIGSKQN